MNHQVVFGVDWLALWPFSWVGENIFVHAEVFAMHKRKGSDKDH